MKKYGSNENHKSARLALLDPANLKALPYIKKIFSGQLWKLNGTKLFNKANLWKSTDEWNLRAEGKMVYVENTSKNKFLGTFDDVFHDETLLLNSVGQMWKKGIATNEGYFTLLDPNSQKVLTASSSHCLEIKGK